MRYLFLVVMALFSISCLAEDVIKIHALHEESFTCTEHWDGQFNGVGDALGTDCVIQEFVGQNDHYFMQSYARKGLENEDWYGYRKDVLAPCDCIVEHVHINAITNKPGKMTPGRASAILFSTEDNTKIVLAHLEDITVKVGQQVKAGEKIAKVGNNGYSRNPHIHVGAWKGKLPLQIRFDQKTLELKDRKTSNN